MIIKHVKIENYRNFEDFEVNLSKLSIIIGENNSGKSNFLNALKLVLSGNDLEYRYKRLSLSDFNSNSVKNYYQLLKTETNQQKLISKIPIIKVTIQFDEILNEYEKAIVGNWINEIDGKVCYEIQYVFKPKSESDFIDYTKKQLNDLKDVEEDFTFNLPTEFYEYSIISTNNGKQIGYNELKNITLNAINAERDDFSESNTMRSNSILTKLLEKELNEEEKVNINNAYNDFFKKIKEQENFKKIFKSDVDFKNLDDFIKNINCIPNLANLKNILSNITLGYGEEFLFQKGLGQRNLIFILLFFQHFKDNESYFNLSCIEEPESHLSTNNLNFVIDYINKSVQKSKSLFQTIISSHNPSIINKLEFNNVIAFSGNKAISFSNVDPNLVQYLSKRPNFDILKLLFSNRIILVEGPTEEMFINTLLIIRKEYLNNIDIISIGQKGYRTFLEIWSKINGDNENKKIGVIRDFDNQPKAKEDHNVFDNNKTIYVRTTENYTLEDDLVSTGQNCKTISKYFNIDNDPKIVSDFLKDSKTDSMLDLCNAISNSISGKRIVLEIPKHINEILEKLQ